MSGKKPIRRREAEDFWAVVRCKTRRERYAAQHLTNQGYQVSLPQLRRTRRIRKQFVSRAEPLFPGYLFVHLSPQLDWRPIQSTRGVSRLLTGHYGPLPVDRAFVEAVLAFSTAGEAEWDRTMLEPAVLLPGEQVQVMNGPMTDMIGEVIALPRNGRVKLLLSFLGAKLEATIPVQSTMRINRKSI